MQSSGQDTRSDNPAFFVCADPHEYVTFSVDPDIAPLPSRNLIAIRTAFVRIGSTLRCRPIVSYHVPPVG